MGFKSTFQPYNQKRQMVGDVVRELDDLYGYQTLVI
jgi:hypothetical protein